MLYVKMCAHRRGVFRPLCIVARKDIIERESVRHCCVTVAAVAIYRMDTQPGSRPATFPAVGLSTRRIIRIGLRAANESRRVGESEARTIDSSSKRKRRCFDIFSHLCFQGSRTHLEPFSRFYKSKEPLYTTLPRRYIAVRIRGFFPYAFYYGESGETIFRT